MIAPSSTRSRLSLCLNGNMDVDGGAQLILQGLCHSANFYAVCGSPKFLFSHHVLGKSGEKKYSWVSLLEKACIDAKSSPAVLPLFILRTFFDSLSSDCCLGTNQSYLNGLRMSSNFPINASGVHQVFAKMTLIISLPRRVASGNRGSKYFEMRSKRSW